MNESTAISRVELSTAQVLTIVTGTKITDMGEVYGAFEKVLDFSPMTHQLPACAQFVKPYFLADPHTSWAWAVNNFHSVSSYILQDADIYTQKSLAREYVENTSEIVGDTHLAPYLGELWAKEGTRVLEDYAREVGLYRG